MDVNSGSGSGLQSDINITPLVDVVLVLLIIFMVVVPMLMQGYKVDIPQASPVAAPAQAEEARVILSITPKACGILEPLAGEGLPADCRVTVADQEIPVGELSGRVTKLLAGREAEKRVLFLDADDRLNYEGVMRIVDLANSGVEDLKIEFIANQ